MNVRELVITVKGRPGGIASVYVCPYCTTFYKRVPKGTTGTGRGYGLATASTASAAVVAHVKKAHADKLAALAAQRAT